MRTITDSKTIAELENNIHKTNQNHWYIENSKKGIENKELKTRISQLEKYIKKLEDQLIYIKKQPKTITQTVHTPFSEISSLLDKVNEKMSHLSKWENVFLNGSENIIDNETLYTRQLLESKLVDMNLSVRALNCLKAAEIETLGELVSWRKQDLMKVRNFGKLSLTELEGFVHALGLKFKTK